MLDGIALSADDPVWHSQTLHIKAVESLSHA